MVTRVEKSPPPGAPGEDDQAGDFSGLDAIAADGAKLDAPKPGDQKAEQQVLASEASEIETALVMIRAVTLPLAQDHHQEHLAALWSDKQLREIAEALVDCARASGITVTDWFGRYGHWVRLGFALGLPAMATIKVLRSPPPPPTAQRTDG
ncbi:hypothetical protein [Hydrogenophaga sp.]|uniref:hypothetical protein n=1 Tax=Hydrogenophaga sp. TaxID=1904254 RepID=UPI00272FAC70|nr:hypothetical protein [Hydrogenophaga sp.]MDP1688029.1 hypothetical protein [Hydrogenophaga sp.]